MDKEKQEQELLKKAIEEQQIDQKSPKKRMSASKKDACHIGISRKFIAALFTHYSFMFDLSVFDQSTSIKDLDTFETTCFV